MTTPNSKLDKKATGGPDPARGIVAINVSAADQVLVMDGRYLFITTAGTISVLCPDGSTGVLTVPLGLLPLQVRTILKTGTTAAGWVFV